MSKNLNWPENFGMFGPYCAMAALTSQNHKLLLVIPVYFCFFVAVIAQFGCYEMLSTFNIYQNLIELEAILNVCWIPDRILMIEKWMKPAGILIELLLFLKFQLDSVASMSIYFGIYFGFIAE